MPTPKHLAAYAACLSAALALLGCDALNYVERRIGMHEKAMRCMASTPAEIQEILKDIQTEPVYQADPTNTVGEVHFELEIPGLDVKAEAETLMFVESIKAGAMVFAGPFQPRFSVKVDKRLIENGPGDSLQFRLFRIHHKQICVQAQQVGDPVWQPGAKVKVRFLRDRYLDKTTGVPIGFEVDVRKP